MVLYRVELKMDEEYSEMIKNIYKFLVILIVFHLLVSYTYQGSKPILFGLSQEFMNDHVMNLIFIGMISIAFYYLVAEKILKFV